MNSKKPISLWNGGTIEVIDSNYGWVTLRVTKNTDNGVSTIVDANLAIDFAHKLAKELLKQ